MSRKKLTVLDSSDEEQVRAALQAQADLDQDIFVMLKSERGRRWLYALIYDKCHVSRLSHVPGDTYSTAFNEGARSIGQAVLEEIRAADHTLYLKMLEENDDG